MLTHPPGSYKPISYEQMYSAVYKWVKKESEASSAGNQKPSILRCVCKQYSEILYRDLFNHMRCEIEIRHSCYIIRVHRVTQTISLYDSSPKNPPSPMVQSPQLCPRWNLHRRVPQGDNISSYLYHMVTRSFLSWSLFHQGDNISYFSWSLSHPSAYQALVQYFHALGGIVPIFTYMNRYIYYMI